MKKRNIIISVCLVAVMLVTMLVPAFAAWGQDDCQCGKAPVIQVRGIGETLYVNGEEVFSAKNIIAGILPVLPQLAQYLADTNNIDLFINAAQQAVTTIFAPVMYDNDGNRENVVTVADCSAPINSDTDLGLNPTSEQTLAYMLNQELGDNHSYIFTYDWTANPYDVANQLGEYIEMVKEKSGHSKVSLCAESMGGAVVNAYIARNPLAVTSIETIVMSNSAFNGLAMIGQLFTGNTDINGAKLGELIKQEILGNAEYAALVPSVGLFVGLAEMADTIIAADTDNRIYNEILIPVFGYIPSFWSLVPADKYDDAENFMLKNAGANLKRFVAGYQSVVSGTTARVQLCQTITDINYYNVSNYNKYIAPVTPTADWNSDGVIETINTSGFATVANMEETLDITYGGDYVDAKAEFDANKEEFLANNPSISPDFVVDASTCQVPTQTWFIKNLGHIAYGMNDGTGDFYVWLLTSTERYTIESNPDYPQFMYYNTTIPQLMTWEEKAEIEESISGGITIPEIPLPEIPGMPEITIPEITLPEIPGFNTDDLIGAIEGGLDSLLGGLGGTGGGGMDLGGIVDTITGVGGMLGGLIGGLIGGGEEPAPEEPETEPETEPTTEPVTEAPTQPAPAPSQPSNNSSNNNQQVNTTPVEVEGGNFNLWLAVVVATLTVLGILVVAL